VADSHDPTDFPAVFSAFPRRLLSPRGGWDVPCPCLQYHRNADRRWSARLWRQGAQMRFWCGRGCRWKDACEATGTRTTDWWLNQGRTMSGSLSAPKVVAEYNYYDYWDGTKRLAYQVVRTDPKGFFQRRPAPVGAGWVAHMGECWAWPRDSGARWEAVNFHDRDGKPIPPPQAGAIHVLPVRRVLYRWPDLRERPDAPVYVVEGEKAADAVAALGYVAVCSPGGAGKWPAGFGGHFVGRRVAVLQDNDDPGEAHAALVAGSLVMYGAAEIRVLRPNVYGFDLGAGEDVYDWLARVASDEQLGPLKAREVRRKQLAVMSRRFPSLTWKAGEKYDPVNDHGNVQRTVVKGERKQNAARAKLASTTDPILG
jgi:hypothetical protein